MCAMRQRRLKIADVGSTSPGQCDHSEEWFKNSSFFISSGVTGPVRVLESASRLPEGVGGLSRQPISTALNIHAGVPGDLSLWVFRSGCD